MAFGDKLKDLAQKAQDAAATHKDQVHQAVLKAEELADQQTAGQHHEQIQKAGRKADAFVDKLEAPEPSAPKPADLPPR